MVYKFSRRSQLKCLKVDVHQCISNIVEANDPDFRQLGDVFDLKVLKHLCLPKDANIQKEWEFNPYPKAFDPEASFESTDFFESDHKEFVYNLDLIQDLNLNLETMSIFEDFGIDSDTLESAISCIASNHVKHFTITFPWQGERENDYGWYGFICESKELARRHQLELEIKDAKHKTELRFKHKKNGNVLLAVYESDF